MSLDTRRRPPVGAGGRQVTYRAAGRPQATATRRHEHPAGVLLEAAVDLATNGWEVFPAGRSKRPLFPRAHPAGHQCRGGCGADGHGYHDATTDVGKVRRWWGDHPGALIAARVPAGLVLVDTDPRHGGEDNLQALASGHPEGLPATLGVWSGRGDGGRHRYLLHPGGTLTGRRLPEGVDLKHHDIGYAIMPPSIHPASGEPYRWADPLLEPAECPSWLAVLLRRPAPQVAPVRPLRPAGRFDGDSIADWFTATATWREVLDGWALVAGDGEADGSKWRHPAATNPTSAQVLHGLLFVYSPGAGLPVCEGAAAPNGLTRFRAWAWLEHGGDLRAAARHARTMRGGAA